MSDHVQQLQERLRALQHAMQSGVEFWQDKNDQSPKHLRVGVNVAMVECAAIAHLLLSKGICTEEEYYQSLVDHMEREVESYRKHIAEQWSVPVEKVNLA